MVFAQILMVLVLFLMISGKTPLYLTAVIGATVTALVAGFPFGGSRGRYYFENGKLWS